MNVWLAILLIVVSGFIGFLTGAYLVTVLFWASVKKLIVDLERIQEKFDKLSNFTHRN